MTEPQDDAMNALLAAARDDRPARMDEERLERRVLGAIAAGTVATVVLPGSKAAMIARLLLSKPVAAFAIVIVGATIAAWVATHDAQTFLAPARPAPSSAPHPVRAHLPTSPVAPSVPAPSLAPSVASPPPVHAARPAHAVVRAPAPHATDVPVAATPTPAPSVTVAQSAPSPDVTAPRATDVPPLAAPSEISLLSRARAGMRSGDVRGALAAIAEHDERYPSGQFGEELDVLRVEALVGSGHAADARARAAQFARQWPGSPYAYRVRRAVGTEAP